MSRVPEFREPPVPSPAFGNVTADALMEEVKSVISRSTALRDRLASTLTPSTVTFDNLIRPLVDDDNFSSGSLMFHAYLMARVAPDPAIREAAREAQKLATASETSNSLRRDVAGLIVALVEKIQKQQQQQPQPHADDGGEDVLDREDLFLLEKMHTQCRLSGALLRDKADRTRFEALKTEIADLLSEAQKTFTEAKEGLWLARSDLEGTSEKWLEGLEVEQQNGLAVEGEDADGEEERRRRQRVWVPDRDDSAMQILGSARRERTRKKWFLHGQTQFPENASRLARIVAARYELARLLGYEHYAAMRIEERMERSVPELQAKIDGLRERLKPLACPDVETLLRLKKEEQKQQQRDIGAEGDHDDDGGGEVQLYIWDRLYYLNLNKKLNYSVDGAKVMEYFEAAHTARRMLGVFETIFGLAFEEVHNPVTWHESVQLYSVWDSDDEGGSFRGYLFMDIYHRPGKTQQQSCMGLKRPFTDASGTRHFAVTSMICGFQQSTRERPGLLTHREARILFHELGHAIHFLVKTTKYAIWHPIDFGEIPSKMLEHFVWVPEVLSELGRHYTSLSEYRDKGNRSSTAEEVEGEGQFPPALAQDLSRTKSVGDALRLLSFLRIATFDLAIHSATSHEEAENMDLTALWNKAFDDTMPYAKDEPLGAGYGNWLAGFRGADVGYYSYLLCEIYATDLYDYGFAADPLSPKAGRKWRHEVLRRGSSQPEMDTLEGYLGRPLSFEASFSQIYEGQEAS